jgi:RHS repeat-associated protein
VVRTFSTPFTFGCPGVFRLPVDSWHDRNGTRIDVERTDHGIPLAVRHSGGYYVAVDTEGQRITALRLLDEAPSRYETHAPTAASAGTVVMRYGYDDEGRLTEVINSSGTPLCFTYDDEGRVTSWTDRNNTSFRYVYDAQGRVVRTESTGGFLSGTLTYDDANRTTTYTDSLGHRTRHRCNPDGQVTEETDALGHITRTDWDEWSHLPLRVTDPLGHVTSYTYDERGSVTSITRPDGRQLRTEYHSASIKGTGQQPSPPAVPVVPIRVTGADGLTWHHTYDERGNRTSTTAPTGATTTYTYDATGHLTSLTNALGHRTEVRCNEAGLPIEVRDPLGAVIRYERDTFGRPITVTDPLGAATHLKWTAEGRPAGRVTADGAVEAWAYDDEGNCTAYTDPQGMVTRYNYGQFDVLTERTDPDGTTHTFDHDTELRLTRVTSPQGLTWDYTYDPAGRLTAESDFDERTQRYMHDAVGRLVSRTTPLGDRITFDRNVLGQTLRKTVATGQAEVTEAVTTYAYDHTDQLAMAVGPDGTTLTLMRDQHGRLLSETVNGRTVTYAYDALGRRIRRTTPSGTEAAWTYDTASRPHTLTTEGRTLTFDRDATGQELTRTLDEAATLTHTYDSLGRLLTQSLHTGDGARRTAHRAYTYRSDGHLTAINDSHSGLRRFDLDAAGRVTTVEAAGWSERYAYDEAGNQTAADWPTIHPGAEARGARTYTGTRITRAGSIHYTHDPAGRITERRKIRLSRKPDIWHYEWDSEDRLTAVTTPDGTRWRYTYDPLGRRTAKQRLADNGTVVEETLFTWDATTLCEQFTTSDQYPNPVAVTWTHEDQRPLTQSEHVMAGIAHAAQSAKTNSEPVSVLATYLTDEPGVPTEPVPDPLEEASTEVVNSRFFAIITDLIGTPTELVDDQGEVAWRTRRTLWGATAWNRSATTYTPLRFPGQYYDPETGLHYNYFRLYDPETARYTAPDPLGLDPAPNPVTYVENPYTWSDPLGLEGCKIRISPVASDWATKGAHMHIGKSEVRVYPTGDGGIGVEGILLRTGMASARDVETARKALMEDPDLRADLIEKARSATEHMNNHNWGNSLNRAAEMNFLIKALERIK